MKQEAQAAIPTTTPKSKLGTDEPSLPHAWANPSVWANGTAPSFAGNLYVPKSINDNRARWHSDRTSRQEIVIGYDGDPYAYTPPTGWKVHSFLIYPVYEMRTYDVQIEKSTCDGGEQTEDKCKPFTFRGEAGEKNEWAKSPFIDSASDWNYQGLEKYYNPKFRKDMDYYRFRTAKIRRVGGDGLGGPGSVIAYKYDFKIEPSAPEPELKLEIEPPIRTVDVGEKTTYKAYYTGSNGIRRDVTNDAASTWSSLDTTIAKTTSTKGEFQGVINGITRVQVKYGSLTQTATISVKPKEGLWIEPPVQTIKVGETANYKAMFQTVNDTFDKTTDSDWSSGDSSIATSDKNGKFTGVKVGTITLTAIYGPYKATATLNVVNDGGSGGTDPGPSEPLPDPNLPPTVTINAPDVVRAGDEFCISANASDPDGTIENYSWNTSLNGTITGSSGCGMYSLKEGQETVTVVVTDDKGATGSDSKKWANRLFELENPSSDLDFGSSK